MIIEPYKPITSSGRSIVRAAKDSPLFDSSKNDLPISISVYEDWLLDRGVAAYFVARRS